MEFFSARRIARIGASAAVYIAATLLCAPLAYETVQFRVSEMLMLLCWYEKDYITAMTVGCLTADLFSSLGMFDVLFGTMATLIAAVLMYLLRKRVGLFTASLFPVISNALIIGLEIKIVTGDPFWINAGCVALGEFVCVSIFGVTVFRLLEKNKRFMKLLTSPTE